MECTRPNRAVYNGTHKSGKNKLKILKAYELDNTDYVRLPCGKCEHCRLRHAKDWANRCELEAKDYPGKNWFITLTYDQKHVPVTENKKTGELIQTLKQKDLTDWLKRTRTHWARKKDHKQGIRYLACGEYGETTARPHYHITLINAPAPTKQELTKLWGKGLVDLQQANNASMAYVAGYTLKKANRANAKIYEQIGIKKEFIVMSRMPGIGHKYYEKNKEKIYATDEIWTSKGAVKPPKYFDKKHEVENYEKIREIKNNRRISAQTGRETLMTLEKKPLNKLLKQQEIQTKQWLATSRRNI